MNLYRTCLSLGVRFAYLPLAPLYDGDGDEDDVELEDAIDEDDADNNDDDEEAGDEEG